MTPGLALEEWRRIFSYNPFHFWGLANATVPVTSGCNALVRQYAWQHADFVGREEISQALETAEDRLREYLGYSPSPKYIEKTLSWPKYDNVGVWRYGNRDATGRMIAVDLGEGYLQALGVELLTDIATAAVTISDEDGDGLDDTFVATAATTVTDPDLIAVYFTATDRLDDEDASEKWRIRPVAVSISGGNVTIRGRSWLLVKPILNEGFNLADQGRDPDTAANFVTNIEIKSRTTNPDGQAFGDAQATLLWETDPCTGWWGCCENANLAYNTSQNDPAAIGYALGRVGIRDAKLGLVLPAQAVYNSTSGLWSAVSWSGVREPDRVTLRYLAGYPLDNGHMDSRWQKIVARLAAAELTRPICACQAANQELYHWQFDVARAAGANDEQYSISPADLDNPLGTRRGQVWAWKQIRNLRLGRSVLV